LSAVPKGTLPKSAGGQRQVQYRYRDVGCVPKKSNGQEEKGQEEEENLVSNNPALSRARQNGKFCRFSQSLKFPELLNF